MRVVQFHCQCKDVATFAQSEVIPEVSAYVHLERGGSLAVQRRQIPPVISFLAYRLVSSTCEEVVYLDVFYFMYSHIVVELMNC